MHGVEIDLISQKHIPFSLEISYQTILCEYDSREDEFNRINACLAQELLQKLEAVILILNYINDCSVF